MCHLLHASNNCNYLSVLKNVKYNYVVGALLIR
jgi:hypothetical protein